MRESVTNSDNKIASIYQQHGEKLRYLFVGIWNTVFNVGLFNALLLIFDRAHTYYLAWFWIAWVVSVAQSTTTMKYLVFKKPGHLWRQIGRAFVIYLPAQGLGTFIFWLVVQIGHLPVPVGQLVTVIVGIVFSYIGHKYFTFRISPELEGMPEDDLEAAAPQGASEA